MWEVYDVNTDEPMQRFRQRTRADECAADMNEGKLDALYKVRRQVPMDPDRERFGSDY